MSARIAILGGGAAGLSTAYFLAARGAGAGVVLLEREPALGTQSSGLNAAILRTLMPDPWLRRAGVEGARFLFDPPAGFTDQPLVDPVGLLLPADGEAPPPLDEVRAQAPEGLELRTLDAAGVRAAAPYYGAPTAGGLLAPTEGRIDIHELVQGFARGARAGGVTIETGAEVVDLRTRDGAVVAVRLASGEELACDTVVVAAGGWAGRLGARAGSRVALRPTRRHLLTTAPDPTIDPRAPIVWTLGDAFYARPESGGLLLCACDEVDVDPDRCGVDPAVREDVARKVAQHLPAYAGAPVVATWAAMRTFSRDRRFLVGPDPDVAGLFWVAGLGGHGMVASASVGRLAADLLGGDASDPLAAAFDPGRFAGAGRAATA